VRSFQEFRLQKLRKSMIFDLLDSSQYSTESFGDAEDHGVHNRKGSTDTSCETGKELSQRRILGT
jgi:hypothetical protein